MLARCLGSLLVLFCWEIWKRVPAWKSALAKGDWPTIEADVLRLAHLIPSEVMEACLSWYLDQEANGQLGKELAQKQGVSSQGPRDVRVTLATGHKITVRIRITYALPRRSKRRNYQVLAGQQETWS